MMSKTLSRLVIIALLVGGFASVATADESANVEAPVVVELFTSQGCNSCPPADAFLGELAQRSDLIALAFHVDYWNYIGWKDPFSSPEASQHQRDYAQSLGLSSIYTPQMVIDGSFDVVGSDRTRVNQAIAVASQRKKFPVSVATSPAGGWVVTIPAADIDEPATVWLALYDRQQTTPVRRGENAGKTLTDYNIVREFHSIGRWDGTKLDLPLDLGATDLAKRGFAVIVQAGTTGPILGAALAPAPNDKGS
jgi:hypothetical protein